jgi:putative ABC transport system permease protein
VPSLFATLNAKFADRAGRTLLSVAGIALGVRARLRSQPDQPVRRRGNGGGHEIALGRGRSGSARRPSGFPESLYPTLARLEGIAVASPVLEVEAGLADGKGTIRLVGIDALRAAQIQPALFADDPARRFELLKPDAVFLSPPLPKRSRWRRAQGFELSRAGDDPARSRRSPACIEPAWGRRAYRRRYGAMAPGTAR